ncbi:helix-turn-helix transcriptional regulator [Solwaraspora sp. WMMB335]|uniref:helix-turn-helix transcriptional regulator n=1 Tax=Solwaraspora sp. WMMB335 TaxID=3404118 RepID=UPI003B9473E3
MRLSELSFSDLDEFSDLVWRTVARHPHSDLSRLAERLNRPEVVVQVELRRLAELGLLHQVGNRWEPQGPVAVLAPVPADWQTKLSAEHAEIAAERAWLYSSGLLDEHEIDQRRIGTTSGVERFSRSEILPGVTEPILADPPVARPAAQAADRIRFLLTGPSSPGRGAAVPHLLDLASEHGVELTNCWTAAGRHGIRQLQCGEHLPVLGRLRVTDGNSSQMTASSDRGALLSLYEDGLGRGGLSIAAPTLVPAVAHLVNRVTQGPLARGVGSTTDGPAIARRQHALLLLFGRGYDDARAARELRVSVRTVKRDVEKLYARWGVSSRFALGAAAVRVGWLWDGRTA